MWDVPRQVAKMTDDSKFPENEETKAPVVSIYDGPSISITKEMKTSYLDYARWIETGSPPYFICNA